MALVQPKAPTQKQLQMNINPKNYQTTLPTLADVQKQYGLTDPTKYADKMSKANAQPKLDGLNAQNDLINQNLKEGQQTLETDYFNQYRNQKQQNALNGLNAGIESQRANLLQMNQGQQMTKLLTDANRQKQDIARQKSTVEVQRQAEALQLRNNELQNQIDISFKRGNFLQAENARRMQLDVQKEQQRIQAVQTVYSNKNTSYWNHVDQNYKQQQFSYQKQVDKIQQNMANRDYNFKVSQAHSDAAYRSQQLQAQREATAATKNQQAQQQKNAVTKMVSDAQIEARTNGANISDVMRGLMNAHTDGLLSNNAYGAAVKKVNQAWNESSYWKKHYGKKK